MTGSELPVVARPIEGELLSSWLDRTAYYHGLKRHHLLSWCGATDRQGQDLDVSICSEDIARLSRLMHCRTRDIAERTHTLLGDLALSLAEKNPGRTVCSHCYDILRREHSVPVWLKAWTEAWRVRCARCNRTLIRDNDLTFNVELQWDWYGSVAADADRGVTRVAASISRARGTPQQSNRRREFSDATTSSGTLWLTLIEPAIVRLFGLDIGSRGGPARSLVRLSLAERWFLLAAVGASTLAARIHARDLLDVWFKNKQAAKQVHRPRQRGRAVAANSGLNNIDIVRLWQAQSRING